MSGSARAHSPPEAAGRPDYPQPQPGPAASREGRAGKGEALEGWPLPPPHFHCPPPTVWGRPSAQLLHDGNPGPSVWKPLLNPGPRTRLLWVLGEPSTGDARPSSPVLAPGQGLGASSHLGGLEHCEPLEAFVGSVWGAAALIAGPGSRLSRVLSREGVGWGVTLLGPGLSPTSLPTGPHGLPSNPPNSLEEARSSRSSLSFCPFPENDYLRVRVVTPGKDLESHCAQNSGELPTVRKGP